MTASKVPTIGFQLRLDAETHSALEAAAPRGHKNSWITEAIQARLRAMGFLQPKDDRQGVLFGETDPATGQGGLEPWAREIVDAAAAYDPHDQLALVDERIRRERAERDARESAAGL